jgi:glycosyltransferase involved in cell wall biosynthesis
VADLWFRFPSPRSFSLPKPLVSICIPTRNRAESLRQSLPTILGQDYPTLEILVSDNCSDDHTSDVVRSFMRGDDRIRYVKHSRNLGLHGNHNFCFDSARGEFICIWHDHDVHDLRIVSEYLAFFEEHQDVGVVCSDWDLINDSGEQIGVRDHDVPPVTPGLVHIGRTIRSGRSAIGIPGAMVRASALGDARFKPDAPIGFGDFPVWFKIAETWNIGHVHKRLWSWRQNEVSHSARTIESIASEYAENLGAYCDEHLARSPAHGDLVNRWRADIRHYLFWALGYEIALHCRKASRGARANDRSLFEIMDYRLTATQFQSAIAQMRMYRTSAFEFGAYAALMTLIRLHLTAPVGWVSRHQVALRMVLGLK